MTYDERLQDAERLNRAWDQVASGRAIAGERGDHAGAVTLEHLHASDETPAPDPAFLRRLRDRLLLPVDAAPVRHPTSRGAEAGLMQPMTTVPTTSFPRRFAVAAVIAAAVIGTLVAGGMWLPESGDVPIVASARASSEAGTPAAGPTSTALAPISKDRARDTAVPLWACPNEAAATTWFRSTIGTGADDEATGDRRQEVGAVERYHRSNTGRGVAYRLSPIAGRPAAK